MPDSELPRTPNWADYIDSLHVFEPRWLVRARRASQAKHSLDDTLNEVMHPIEERAEPRPAAEL